MSKKYQDFTTKYFPGSHFTTLEATIAWHGERFSEPLLRLNVGTKCAYITKEQAMDFFGLVDPEDVVVEHHEAKPVEEEVVVSNKYIVYYTHTHSRAVMVHITNGVTSEEAIRNARNEINHGIFVLSVHLK